MNNLTSFKDFRKIKEAKEFTNDTTWNQSLVGKFVNATFKGIGKILKFGYQQGLMVYSETKIRNEFFKGIILWAYDNNFDLESGNFISAEKRSQEETQEDGSVKKEKGEEEEESSTRTKSRMEADLEETYNTVADELQKVNSLDDIRNSSILTPHDFQKLIGKYRQDIRTYENQIKSLMDDKAEMEKEIKKYKNPGKKKAELDEINNKIENLRKKIENAKRFININLKTFNLIKEKVKELGGSVTNFGEIVGGGGSEKESKPKFTTSSITSKNIGDELNNLSELKNKIERDKLVNITNVFNQAINNMEDIDDEKKKKFRGWLKGVVGDKIYQESVNENLIIGYGYELINEKKVGTIFSNQEKKQYGLDKEIRNIDLKKINFEKLSKVIDKEEASKKVNINRIYSYHLSVENAYITTDDGRNTENKKLKNQWVKKLNNIKADFRDFLQVEKLDPTSEAFLLNKSKIKEIEKDYEDSENNIAVNYKLADEARERVKRFNLKNSMLSVDDMRKKDNYYLITSRWGYKSKSPSKKVVFSAKYINILGYDVLAVTNTYSEYFIDEFDINKNKNVVNKKNKIFMDYLYGEEYEYNKEHDVRRYRLNDVKNKMVFLFCKNMTLPQAHSTEMSYENSFYVFNILEDDLYVPKLATSKEEKTISKPIENVVKDKESDNKMNKLKIELYPSYTINETDELIDKHMKVKNIEKFKESIENYFKVKFK